MDSFLLKKLVKLKYLRRISAFALQIPHMRYPVFTSTINSGKVAINKMSQNQGLIVASVTSVAITKIIGSMSQIGRR